MDKDWKLKLRYGKTQTPYCHYTVIANGIAGNLEASFDCPPGNAYMAMKTWSSSPDESADMAQSIGRQIGFECNGKIEIYETEPTQPPRENPYGYDIQFTPYDPEI